MQDWAWHGGRIDTASGFFADAPHPWLDLSTGINPVAWDGIDLSAVDLRALPDVSALGRLEAMAGAMFGAAYAAVAALPGSEIGLRSLASIGLPAPYHLVVPGYGTHRSALPDARPIAFADIDAAADAGGTLLFANPNNPDGRTMEAHAVRALGRRIGRRGGWLIVDEAFADTDPAKSVVPALGVGDNILVMRSFGKFFGIAGVRLGFAVGPAAMVDRIRERLGSWPVSSLAIAIGIAAYRDGAWIDATRLRLRRDAAVLDGLLAGHGLLARGDCPLFRLVETPDASAIFARLANAGILTRPFDYAPGWLRFGLPPDAAAYGRLDRALANG